ncbi:MAG TPA: hypothetical protein VGS79_00380 [Puia sp.]|nr:hypothetical protein [Puia sp.]
MRLFIRVRWLPFLLVLFLAVVLFCWSAERSFRHALSKPAGGVVVSPRYHEQLPLSQAHVGWVAVRAWERMMDSLRVDARGRRIYDSILAARPGILDSAKKAEEFFYSHDH